jgi:hypothetical protein
MYNLEDFLIPKKLHPEKEFRFKSKLSKFKCNQRKELKLSRCRKIKSHRK